MAIPLYDFQYIPNFIKEINAVFQKNNLTPYSEDRNEGEGAGNGRKTGTRQVEPAVWPPAHCEALKEFVAKGMSYTEAANAINARFGTEYSRSAALGRARRMGLAEVEPPRSPSMPAAAKFQPPAMLPSDEFALLKRLQRRPSFPRLKGAQLRCVEVIPRHLDVVDLERDDCRYPYGGGAEGEAITFCGHPRRKGRIFISRATPMFRPSGPSVSHRFVWSLQPVVFKWR